MTLMMMIMMLGMIHSYGDGSDNGSKDDDDGGGGCGGAA